MGQKVTPVGLRVGINRTWDSRWYASRDFADKLHEDLFIKSHIKKKLGFEEQLFLDDQDDVFDEVIIRGDVKYGCIS